MEEGAPVVELIVLDFVTMTAKRSLTMPAEGEGVVVHGWPQVDAFNLTEDNPVVDVLSHAMRPWSLRAVWENLRLGGMPIPYKVELEATAALHFMLWHALHHGHAWRRTMMDDLKERQYRGLEIAVAQAGFRAELDS
jgi:hypothetical protein